MEGQGGKVFRCLHEACIVKLPVLEDVLGNAGFVGGSLTPPDGVPAHGVDCEETDLHICRPGLTQNAFTNARTLCQRLCISHQYTMSSGAHSDNPVYLGNCYLLVNLCGAVDKIEEVDGEYMRKTAK